jgi:hypothetical protein
MLETKLARVKELISKREEIDAELAELLGVEPRERKERRCSKCGEPGHRAGACTKNQGSSAM